MSKDQIPTVTSDAFLPEGGRIDDAPLPDADDALVGSLLGRFRITSLLGKGGMGLVYLAEDETLRRDVALKVLSPDMADDPDRRGRLLREARAAAAVNHSNIAAVYDVGEANGLFYIAMERIGGESLRARLDQRRLTMDETVRLAKQILEGLSKAHEAGIIHRDLKPDNVMVDENGHVKILDFGLAKFVERGRDQGRATTMLTEEGQLLGTPSYMSPEQAAGLPVDARGDVFALGIVLYEMVTGELPFQGSNFLKILAAIERDNPAAPSQKNAAVSPDIERVILRCLNKDPADRYENAREVLADLTAEKSASPAPENVPKPAEKQTPKWFGVAAMAVLLAIVATAGFAGRITPTKPNDSRAATEPSTSGSASPIPTTLVDLPLPTSTNPEALVAYKRGILKLRNGEGVPELHFRRAIDLDPALGAAYVQALADGDPRSFFVSSRRDYARKANELSKAMSERDREILTAIDPVVRGQPADHAETIRRLSKLIDRWPGDAQLWYLRAQFQSRGAPMAIMNDARRAIELDGGFSRAYAKLAEAQQSAGQVTAARETLNRCLEVVPTAATCMAHMMTQFAFPQGQCAKVEQWSRSITSIDPEMVGAYVTLSDALAAQQKPPTAVREAILQWEKLVEVLAPESFSKPFFLPAAHFYHQYLVDMFVGDFDAAEKNARQIALVMEPSQRQGDHSRGVQHLSDTLLESGRINDAALVAKEFLDRRSAWEPDSSGSLMRSPSYLRIAFHAGKISRHDFIAQRDALLHDAQSAAAYSGTQRWQRWYNIFVVGIDTPDEAREALAEMRNDESLPTDNIPKDVAAYIGRAYQLAGRSDEAIGFLEQSIRHCSVFFNFSLHIRAHLWLGQAKEQKGDKSGACTAYNFVLDKWGNAKPKSVTADEARKRANLLRCSR